ncbi:MAG: hypothetical protein IJL68_06075 [Bacteroidales bacterium]|nr:hypothetical protein [Bacteroidales bacterium]
MKKIIYSLVIMIAAGSLFTSCIDQVEPVGILDMRSAKAEYIRALKNLRDADAEFRRAEAALKQADARYRDAETAWMNAQTENQNLLNELQALLNEAQAMENELRAAQIADEIARMEMKMEEDAKQHEINMLDLEKNLNQAAEDLRVALRNIALHSQDLTNDEKLAVAEAVAIYEGIFEVYQKQVVKVKEAQAKLDSLKEWKNRFADKGWDSGNHKYDYKVQIWQREITRAEKRIEAYKAKLEDVPNPDEIDMNAWNAELEAMQAEIDALTYNFATTTTKEVAEYYVNHVHDGVKQFNDAVKVFMAQFDGYNLTPLTKTEEALIKAGEKTQDDFKQKMADSIAFPKFPKGEISPATFNKFGYLLKSYVQAAPNATTNIMAPAADTIKIVGPVNQAMKDFIMGKAGNGEKSQKYEYTDKNKVKQTLYANYGLWGAYDILERELVTTQEEAASEEKVKELEKEMKKQDSIWAAHRQILIDGLAKFEPYTKAIDEYTKAVEKNGNGAKGMVQAIKDIKTAFGHVKGLTQANFDYYDSTEFFKAIIAFAKAREEYLDYTAPKAADIDPQSDTKRDSTVFYYSKGKSGAGKPILASKKFTELTWDELRAGEYEYDTTNPGDNTPYGSSQTNAFGNIIKQLMGANFATALTGATIADPTVSDAMTSALYNTYTLVTWDDPKKIQKGGEDYMSADITAKKKAVKDAVQEYLDVYNSFWNKSVTAAGTEYDAYFTAVESNAKAADIAKAKTNAEKAIAALLDPTLDPKCYTLNTFKPYEDKAPIVTFSDGTNVDNTDAINAVLTAVDPSCTDKTDNKWFETNPISGGAIFNGNNTDFYKAMKAEYDYYVATNPKITDELAAVKAWIEEVEKTFKADADKTGQDDTAAYKAWQKAYKAATDHAADLIEFLAALAEFAGVDEEGDPNAPVVIPDIYDSPETIAPNNVFYLFDTNVLGDVTGWMEGLGGKQLELAKELFPDFPTVYAEWKIATDEYLDAKEHLDILMESFKAAYFAAAKAAGYDEFNKEGKAAADWDALYKAYKNAREAYVEKLKQAIKDDTKVIDDNAKKIADYWSEVPAIDIEIADAQANLTIEKQRLGALEQALALAKANMEKILEYVQSQDANFVLLNAYSDKTDVDASALQAALQALKSLGISIPGLV